MSQTPEGRVKKAVKLLLNLRRVWFYSPVQMGMGVVGIPDLICCKPVVITKEMVGTKLGVFLAVEVKAPGKLANVTPNQQARINEIKACGGMAIVVDNPLQLEEFLNGR